MNYHWPRTAWNDVIVRKKEQHGMRKSFGSYPGEMFIGRIVFGTRGSPTCAGNPTWPNLTFHYSNFVRLLIRFFLSKPVFNERSYNERSINLVFINFVSTPDVYIENSRKSGLARPFARTIYTLGCTTQSKRKTRGRPVGATTQSCCRTFLKFVWFACC